MTTKIIIYIFWLRYQLLCRLLFNRKNLPFWLMIISAVLFLIYFLVSNSIVASVFSVIISHRDQYFPGFLFLLLLFLITGTVIYFLFVGINLKDAIQYKKLAFMPVKHLYFYLTEILASMFDLWSLLVIPIFAGMIIGLKIYSDFLSLSLAVLVLFSFLIFIAVFSHFVAVVLESLFCFFSGGWFKSLVTTILLFVFLMLLFLPILLIGEDLVGLCKTITDLLVNKKILFTPPGLFTDSIVELTSTEHSKVVFLYFPLIWTYIILFFLAGCNLSLYVSKRSARSSDKVNLNTNIIISRIETLTALFFRKNRTLPKLLSKEILYVFRSHRMKLLMAAILIGEIFQFNYLFYPEHYLSGIFLLTIPTTYMIMDLNYVFFYDGKAIKSLFYFPVDVKNIILSKNIAIFSIIILVQFVSFGLAFIILGPVFNLNMIVSSLLISLFLMMSNSVFMNYSACTNPKRLDFNSLLEKSISNSIWTFVSLIITMIPVVVAFVLFFQSQVLVNISLLILFVIALIIYVFSLTKISEKLLKNREKFVNRIAG